MKLFLIIPTLLFSLHAWADSHTHDNHDNHDNHKDKQNNSYSNASSTHSNNHSIIHSETDSAIPAVKHPNTHSSIDLPSDIRALLIEEMQAIKKGMETLSFAIPSANWQTIEETGTQIQNSYILKKNLTQHQLHQLHNALPEGFKILDQRLHHYAGKLSDAAEEKDVDLVVFYQYKMVETCTSCHKNFASDVFKGFKESAEQTQHEH